MTHSLSTTDDRIRIRAAMAVEEAALVEHLISTAALDTGARTRIAGKGADLVRSIRASDDPGLMEVFLAEYGLSTDEGIALMCLAEALLRVPDADTIDALIEDKIAPSDWGRHLGHSASSMVNASTWALMLTGRVLDDPHPGIAGALRAAIRRVGEPVIRAAVGRAMREMGNQFVLGETIQAAVARAGARVARGFTHSYDMLGEAARTDRDARRYHLAYGQAITALAPHCTHTDIAANPGISVKLSALHPRYETAKAAQVMRELLPRIRTLAQLAATAGMGLNIDAEESERLELSLDIVDALLADPALAGWDGLGVVVQAYGRRALPVIEWLHAAATRHDRRIMVRLVKGAYWDTEIKRAQVMGLPRFPVFTTKAATDISYVACARRLLDMQDRIYPQFATHNAHTVAAILDMAPKGAKFEFQRLHGMGEQLHDIVAGQNGTRCRIYAPVGAHEDLLAYLVRRLLENGANSSFVHQIVDAEVPPETVAADPVATWRAQPINPAVLAPVSLFGAERENSVGEDLGEPAALSALLAERDGWKETRWQAVPVVADRPKVASAGRAVANPARPGDQVGTLVEATKADVQAALGAAAAWDAPVTERAAALRRAADAYEANRVELYALLAREAGKTLLDAVGEVREAVDFLRYYATEAQGLNGAPRGTFVCISPWNFPLAIFTGQIAAALATGNAVIAKPAEQTPLIAARAVALLHDAGVPVAALQFLPGPGETVGAALTGDPGIDGVCFTGGTDTAQAIHRAMAEKGNPTATLIAETGGQNAMIVDSTALPEQAVRDILASAFQSAGQRCSALRCLYVQDDVADRVLSMLFGAMNAFTVGDPWDIATDVGPVIDDAAASPIRAHVARAEAEGRILHRLADGDGRLVGPTVISVGGIGDIRREVFGPVLHVARFRSEDLEAVVDAVNATGYGLTFGLHTRIDDRVQAVLDRVETGNVYVNRNQIGAVVGSQPFGGEGLSGTGPKAGGPDYLLRFLADAAPSPLVPVRDMPGPTGESNRLHAFARDGAFLCLGPGEDAAAAQAMLVRSAGAEPRLAADAGADALADPGIAGALWWGDKDGARAYRQALAAREGPILPLITGRNDTSSFRFERHVCIDTTAAGGNAALLAGDPVRT